MNDEKIKVNNSKVIQILERKLKLMSTTKLEDYIIDYYVNYGKTNDGIDLEEYMKSIVKKGCKHIMVGLLYYTNNTLFYNRFKDEINVIIRESLEKSEYDKIKEYFLHLDDFINNKMEYKNAICWLIWNHITEKLVNNIPFYK